MKWNNRITDFVLDLYHVDALSDEVRNMVDVELSKDEEFQERYREILMADKEIQQLFSDEKYISPDHISDFMLSLYHLGALSDEERKIVETEMENNLELAKRYHDIKESEDEIRSRFGLNNPLASAATERAETATKDITWVNVGIVFQLQFLINAGILLRLPTLLSSSRRNRNLDAVNEIKNEFDAEITKYEVVFQTNPNDYDACITLACLYNNRNGDGDTDKVIEYCDRALVIKINDPLALCIRGIARSENGDKKAFSDLEAVLKTNTLMSKEILYTFGKIHFKEGDFEKARKAFETVKEIDPDFADVNKILSDLLQ